MQFVGRPGLCLSCRHLHEEHRLVTPPGNWLPFDVMCCDAFPNGIPIDISRSRFDHRHEYPGDNGIRFKLGKPMDADRLQALLDSTWGPDEAVAPLRTGLLHRAQLEIESNERRASREDQLSELVAAGSRTLRVRVLAEAYAYPPNPAPTETPRSCPTIAEHGIEFVLALLNGFAGRQHGSSEDALVQAVRDLFSQLHSGGPLTALDGTWLADSQDCSNWLSDSWPSYGIPVVGVATQRSGRGEIEHLSDWCEAIGLEMLEITSPRHITAERLAAGQLLPPQAKQAPVAVVAPSLRLFSSSLKTVLELLIAIDDAGLTLMTIEEGINTSGTGVSVALVMLQEILDTFG